MALTAVGKRKIVRMKINDKRDRLHELKVPAWMHHVDCQCGIGFGWEPSKGSTVMCPSCHATEVVAGADVSPIAQPQ